MKSKSRYGAARRALIFWTLFIGLGAVGGAIMMPIEPINIDLTAYDKVTICSPIWVFALASPVRAFCRAASGQIKSVDYVLVHHTNGRYENAADEMDSLLGVKRGFVRSIRCRKGKFKVISE